MNSVPPSANSIASALTAKARSLGMMFGMLVTAALVSLKIGDEPLDRHPLRFIETMEIAFAILAALAFAALIVSAMRPVKRP
jgi:hypothetical protein